MDGLVFSEGVLWEGAMGGRQKERGGSDGEGAMRGERLAERESERSRERGREGERERGRERGRESEREWICYEIWFNGFHERWVRK